LVLGQIAVADKSNEITAMPVSPISNFPNRSF